MPSPKDELAELAQRAQGGEVEAYTALFNRLSGPVLNYVYRMLGERPAAEDVTQDAFIRAYDRIDKLGPPWDFKSWVYRIASNMAVDHLRSHRRFVDTEDIALMTEPGTGRRPAEHSLQEDEQRRQVWKILSALPTPHRQALILREFNGFNYKEISAALETSPENARQLVHRGRMRFREVYRLQMTIEASMERCRALGELLSAYQDAELDQNQLQVVEEHLEICPECQATKKDMKLVGALLAVIPPLVPDPAWAASLLEKILSKVNGQAASQKEKQPGSQETASSHESLAAPSSDGSEPSLWTRLRRRVPTNIIRAGILIAALSMTMIVGGLALKDVWAQVVPILDSLNPLPALFVTATPTDASGDVLQSLSAGALTKEPFKSSPTSTSSPTPTVTLTPLPTDTPTPTSTSTATPTSTSTPTDTTTPTAQSYTPGDTEPPVVDIQHSPSGSRRPTSTEKVTFHATAQDNVGVVLIEIWVQVGKARLTLVQSCKNTTSCRHSDGPFSSREQITYVGRAFDAAGNVGESIFRSFYTY